MLKNYLNEEDLAQIYETFEPSMIESVDEKNMSDIIEYLNKNVTITKDILLYYLDLFTFESKEFIRKFERLKSILGENYSILLEANIDFLEKMYKL